jgi:hypothetical protein
VTLLSDAEAIRDATLPSANTPDIVGGWMVDAANAIRAAGYATINSASFSITNGAATICTNDEVFYPVTIETVDTTSVVTGTGISVTEKTTDGDDYSYFSELDSTHAYKVDYNFYLIGAVGEQNFAIGLVEFEDAEISPSKRIQVTTPDSGSSVKLPCSYSNTITGVTSCVLAVQALTGGDGDVFNCFGLSASIVDLGLAV